MLGDLMKNLIYVPLYNILIFFYVFVRDMGLSVILLTIFVRLLLLRQSVKAEKSRLAIQKLQPEIKKIQQQYKNDKEKQTKATLDLYQKRNVNPFSSCLPTLFQLPFLIGLFVVFKEGLKNGFALYEPVKNMVGGLTINAQAFGFLNLTATPNQGLLLILPILAASVQFIQSKMMMSQTDTPGSSSIMYILPGITLLFTMTLPSAMSLYWIATTIFAIVQQVLIDKAEKNKTLDELTSKGNK